MKPGLSLGRSSRRASTHGRTPFRFDQHWVHINGRVPILRWVPHFSRPLREVGILTLLLVGRTLLSTLSTAFYFDAGRKFLTTDS